MTAPARPKPPHWTELAFRLLPFADAASEGLPLPRLLRLSLFQVSVGMATVLLNGTLNRVMVVELGTPTWLVALLIAVPLLVAPFRALIGHKSDTHRSVLGWRRVPYIWFGTLMQFGGLAIMPFALLLLDVPERFEIGLAAATAAFLLTGIGFHVTQTAGLALATDLAPEDKRPRAVALLYVMLLVGMMFAAFVIGGVLADYSATKLVQVIQGCALLTVHPVREVLSVNALPGEEEHDYHTVAGMVIARFGRIPHAGELFDWEGWRFEVVDLDGARIDKLLIGPRPQNDAAFDE